MVLSYFPLLSMMHFYFTVFFVDVMVLLMQQWACCSHVSCTAASFLVLGCIFEDVFSTSMYPVVTSSQSCRQFVFSCRDLELSCNNDTHVLFKLQGTRERKKSDPCLIKFVQARNNIILGFGI